MLDDEFGVAFIVTLVVVTTVDIIDDLSRRM